MAQVQAREVDVVMVWRFDRWARSTGHLIESLDEMREHQVDFLSLTEAVDTTAAMGRFVFTVLGAVAELERNIIRERVAAGIARARAEGVKLGRPRRHIDLDLARQLLDQGASLRQVSLSLNVSRRALSRRLKEARARPGTRGENLEPILEGGDRGTKLGHTPGTNK